MARSVPEWRGKTDDSPIPPRVRLRIFDHHGGICHLSGRKIMAGEPWDCDHIVALVNGGEHSERNLAPVLVDKHKEKTKLDLQEKSRNYKKRTSFLGIKQRKSRPMFGSKASGWKRGFDGVVRRREK